MKISFASSLAACGALLLLSGCLASASTSESDSSSGVGPTGTAAATSSGSGSAAASSSGTSTGGSSSTGSGGGATSSGTTGGAFNGCPAGWPPCTPANVCDQGCAPDAGLCVDELAANPAQTGASCASGAVCEGTQCTSISGPQVPNQQGGVISSPNIVMMTFDSDGNQGNLESWGVWIADGGYLKTTGADYGVSNGTIQFVRLSDTPPSQDSIPGYLQTHFDHDSTMPAFSQSNIYILFMPPDWPDTGNFCKSEGGYHTGFQDNQGDFVVYAVVADCRADLQGDTEVAGAHEILEAATDPFGQSWTFAGTNNPWSYIGGEIGDMCESNTNYYTTADGLYAGQYLWSNSAARSGQVPCQPWPADQLYVDVLGPPTMVPGAPGTVVNIPLTGWASGPTPDWALVAQDAFFQVNFYTYPQLSDSTIGPGRQVNVELNVPAEQSGQPVLGGLVGAAWVFSAVGNSAYYGSTVVGVIVSCETNADCSDEAFACIKGDGGTGTCGYNFCPASAAPFSTCAAAGADDGVCMPYSSSTGGAVEICTQAGSLAVGASGCAPNRVSGGGASDYCAPTASCAGTNSPTCLEVCTGVGTSLQGTCSTGQVCLPQAQYWGVCVQECNPSACPGGQQCYSTGTPGLDVCYPN